VPFSWGGIGADNQALLDLTAKNANKNFSNILGYVRGNRANEYPNGLQYRARISILGDIINSKPVYVAEPSDNRIDNGYSAWALEHKDREPRVYVGANDGMLHAFNAATGEEEYAYVPSMLMGTLRNLSDVPHKHTYFVDGQLTVRDAFFGSGGKASDSNAKWHTVLTGSVCLH